MRHDITPAIGMPGEKDRIRVDVVLGRHLLDDRASTVADMPTTAALVVSVSGPGQSASKVGSTGSALIIDGLQFGSFVADERDLVRPGLARLTAL